MWGIAGVPVPLDWHSFLEECKDLDLRIPTRIWSNYKLISGREGRTPSNNVKKSERQWVVDFKLWAGRNENRATFWARTWVLLVAAQTRVRCAVESNAFLKLFTLIALALRDIGVLAGFASYATYYSNGDYAFLALNGLMWLIYIGGGAGCFLAQHHLH
jgi:hypothetical protein